ncbi:unnamed protein product [Ixodes persulcatus]
MHNMNVSPNMRGQTLSLFILLVKHAVEVRLEKVGEENITLKQSSTGHPQQANTRNNRKKNIMRKNICQKRRQSRAKRRSYKHTAHVSRSLATYYQTLTFIEVFVPD